MDRILEKAAIAQWVVPRFNKSLERCHKKYGGGIRVEFSERATFSQRFWPYPLLPLIDVDRCM